jgi:hypothetical protein
MKEKTAVLTDFFLFGHIIVMFTTIYISLFWLVAEALVLPGDVGKLPALGWNTWNAYGCDINETVILSAAESIVSLGFKVILLCLIPAFLCLSWRS